MTFTIHTGHHRGHPAVFGIGYNKELIQRDVLFGEGCAYSIEGDDMNDTNKLFGIGYVPGWKAALILLSYTFIGLLFKEHHKDSVRFGWRYNPQSDKILISAYVYDSGKLIIHNLCEVPRFHWYRLSIYVFRDDYLLEVTETYNPQYKLGSMFIDRSHKKKVSYRLGIYFGGQSKAPHDIQIEMKKVKLLT